MFSESLEVIDSKKRPEQCALHAQFYGTIEKGALLLRFLVALIHQTEKGC
jgi:hypothetical protein